MAYIFLAWLYCLVISIDATPLEQLNTDLLRTSTLRARIHKEREPLNDVLTVMYNPTFKRHTFTNLRNRLVPRRTPSKFSLEKTFLAMHANGLCTSDLKVLL
jgi:hypothetical protein